MNGPKHLCVNAGGNVLIADTENHRIRIYRPGDGSIRGVAGTGRKGAKGLGGPPAEAELSQPHGVTVGPGGVLYISDSSNDRILKIVLQVPIQQASCSPSGTFGTGSKHRAIHHLRERPWSRSRHRCSIQLGLPRSTGREETTMAGEKQSAFVRGIEHIFNQGSLTGLSEGQLLRPFRPATRGRSRR